MLGIITDIEVSKIEALEKINNYVAPKLLVNKLTTKRMNAIKANKPKYHIACLDLGYKQNVVNVLTSKKCNVTMLPYNVDAAKILATNANALVITDGPDNPADLNVVVETVKSLIGKLPIVGIGLGHLIVACASGAEVVKMKYGHHGANQSVKCLKNNKILITNQAHQYEVSKESLENTILKPTYINLSDGSIEGLISNIDKVVTSQFDLFESSSSPSVKSIYDELVEMIKSAKGGNK
jgi:carbamoyl-phosphate synthase small subunit